MKLKELLLLKLLCEYACLFYFRMFFFCIAKGKNARDKVFGKPIMKQKTVHILNCMFITDERQKKDNKNEIRTVNSVEH